MACKFEIHSSIAVSRQRQTARDQKRGHRPAGNVTPFYSVGDQSRVVSSPLSHLVLARQIHFIWKIHFVLQKYDKEFNLNELFSRRCNAPESFFVDEIKMEGTIIEN